MGILDRLFSRKTGPRTPRSEPDQSPSSASEDDGLGAGSPLPPRCPGNPGQTSGGRIEFSNGERSWTESFDLVTITADVLRSQGHEVVERGTWLELRPSAFVLQPQLVGFQALEKGGTQTLTTMDVRHAELIKDGLFEYQHSTGDDVTDSLAKGIESWAKVDLPVLLDVLRPKPKDCSMWEMKFPAKDGRPERTRRAVLGNVAYFAKHTTPPRAALSGQEGEGEHSFCNCCFLTRNFEAFRAQLEGDGYFGIRFYALREEDGTLGADCRVNGEDYEPGIEALRSYVATWPGEGFEFRKQYVFIHTIAATNAVSLDGDCAARVGRE
jgi:hypothetical protein